MLEIPVSLMHSEAEQELQKILYLYPSNAAQGGSKDYQHRLELASNEAKSAAVQALIADQLRILRSVNAQVPDPSVSQEADSIQFGGSADPRVNKELNELMAQIPAQTGPNVMPWQDEIRKLKQILAHTNSREMRAEIQRRFGTLHSPKELLEEQSCRLNAALSKSTTAALRAEILRRLNEMLFCRDPLLLRAEAHKLEEELNVTTSAEIRAENFLRRQILWYYQADLVKDLLECVKILGTGAGLFVVGVGLYFFMRWMERISLGGILGAILGVFLGPLIMGVGAMGVFLVLLRHRKYLSAALTLVALVGSLFGGWQLLHLIRG